MNSVQLNFSIHNSFFSDHFAIQVLLYIDRRILPQIFIPRWNLSKADWPKYITKLSEVSQLDVEPFSIDEESRQLIFMFNVAAEHAIPKTKPYKFIKSHWYRDDDLIKAQRIANKAMKHYKRLPNPNNKLALQEASHNLRITAFQSKNNSWLKWVNQLNGQTRNRDFWRRIKSVKGTPTRPDIHPNPENKANELIDSFAQRTLVTNLPLHTQRDLNNKFRHRQQLINKAINVSSTSNTPFTIQELDIALLRSRDTAPGEDNLSYSMISKSSIETKTIMLRLFNKSSSLVTLPSSWKHSLLVPIPKPGNNGYRPISLLSCLSKVMEILILNRLTHCAKPLHKNSMGFKKGSGTTDAVAALVTDLTSHREKGTTAIFIDLEKAFELSNRQIMLTSRIPAGVKGNLIKWLKDYLSQRTPTLIFQGAKSNIANFNNGTP